MANADFSRSRLDQMIDLSHPLAVLGQRLPWERIEALLSPYLAHRNRPGKEVCESDLFGPMLAVSGGGVSAAGRPRLPIRLMVSLLYLKHRFNLSDEAVVERWSENVVWQYFSGREYYEPRLPCDATQIGRFRNVIGEAGVEVLLQATIETAVSLKAVREEEFERVIVDTTVQEKAVAYPTDRRLLEAARAKLVAAARAEGIVLKLAVRPREVVVDLGFRGVGDDNPGVAIVLRGITALLGRLQFIAFCLSFLSQRAYLRKKRLALVDFNLKNEFRRTDDGTIIISGRIRLWPTPLQRCSPNNSVVPQNHRFLWIDPAQFRGGGQLWVKVSTRCR